jgi:AhpD family alkylhydroperoxidase
MNTDPLQGFRAARTAGMERLLKTEHLGIKRFLSLDSAAYRDDADAGRLDARTKELCGLSASAVLRCDDCINYHLERCVAEGCTLEQVEDALNVALVVGGSIVIPHLRRAMFVLDELIAERDAGD